MSPAEWWLCFLLLLAILLSHCSDLTFTLLCGLTCDLAFKEETLLQKDIRCHSRLFPRVWDLRQLQVR
jgi:hypothetical protein